MKVAWYVERIAWSIRWRGERMELSEVLEDLRQANEAGDQLRFIAPPGSRDEDLQALITRGAVPTFRHPISKESDPFMAKVVQARDEFVLLARDQFQSRS